jgi:hypothetical protein
MKQIVNTFYLLKMEIGSMGSYKISILSQSRKAVITAVTVLLFTANAVSSELALTHVSAGEDPQLFAAV